MRGGVTSWRVELPCRLRLQAGRSGCGVFERGAPLDAVMGPAGLWSEDRPGDAQGI